jgi:MFS family permease
MVARAGQQRLWAMIGTAAFGISAAAIAISAGPMFFVVAMCGQAFLCVFTMPFITAVAIDQDRSGGLAVAASGWSNLIGAGAPALAGMLARSGEFENLAWLALVSTVFSVVGLAMVGRGVRRKPAFATIQSPTAPE